jgi:homospermidine synthase
VITHGANPGRISHWVKQGLVNLARDLRGDVQIPQTREGWGTHEKHFPADGHRHDSGSGAAIYLDRPGMSVEVRSWTPAPAAN